MPWLMMYLVDEDVATLCRMLDEDPNVAVVRADGPGRWKAQRNVPKLRDGEHALWHVPSGPINLEPTDLRAKPQRIKNPFAGWHEIVKPFEPGVPWFGPAPTGIIWLCVRRRAGSATDTFSPMTARWTAPANEVIGLSSFGWIGNYYSIIGNPAPESTMKWWKSLGRRVAKVAVRVPSSGPLSGKDKDVWAFPAALAKIRQGRKRADNPT